MLKYAKDAIVDFFKVEKNVPIPTGRHERTKYPFGRMVIGDSFVVTGKEKAIVRSAAYEYSRRHGTKFVTRRDGDGMRVWRLS